MALINTPLKRGVNETGCQQLVHGRELGRAGVPWFSHTSTRGVFQV
ncbi:MAG: hypothetical protein NTW03_08255 [Verrucomicrobia bacterium]|nr:hypothetical protein [Verrucomicrobiota bacterium]